MELISEKVATMLEGIMGACFEGNRVHDRAKAALAVDFVMPSTSNWLHYNVAHKYPVLADEVADYMENRNHSEKYPATPAGNIEYNTSHEVFEGLLSFYKQFEQLIKDGIAIADAEGDRVTVKFLDKFLLEQVAYTNVGLTLCDLSEQYGDEPKDNMQFDMDINKKLKGLEP